MQRHDGRVGLFVRDRACFRWFRELSGAVEDLDFLLFAMQDRPGRVMEQGALAGVLFFVDGAARPIAAFRSIASSGRSANQARQCRVR
ncbi:hypothetical protein XdyCFBP7245_02655 [Xanthomonas dyei]|uniref:Uncharacterized protein n=1 Tax=Xanthomonas dyei TaxID=743699 RepID=A0A2S7CA30_9XANT|nr:hypothetical protein XdyCFBP7245_02655 [Xanthomonas dyei]